MPRLRGEHPNWRLIHALFGPTWAAARASNRSFIRFKPPTSRMTPSNSWQRSKPPTNVTNSATARTWAMVMASANLGRLLYHDLGWFRFGREPGAGAAFFFR